ncbi:MAG: DNA mismatch repair endonuclease MutL [Lachnospiraceae bacterium]|nr:DNA mismatch repair endonuclease MutL [Lachnospiraceae bacterium]
MALINILDHQTIDKIAAGEVVERPSSVVKELVENAIDAGASAVTVEIKDGGTSLIRVTDNGGGIEKSQIRNAFLRHATSKITSADDLTKLVSLGFRGEALASIAAVAMVELISKTPQELTGIRYVIEGGMEKEQEEIGAPEGTTVLVRNLFYNTPPRRKFLKQPQTEGSYVADLMEHLAMSNPDISFKFIINGQTRFYTSGNHELQEIIYRIYGKEIAAQLVPFHYEDKGIIIDGLLGKPVINRSNRNYEIFYVNGRYIKSTLISKAIEEGYREYLMQHKFPFCVLHFTIDTDRIDVNVHPTKMEIRIADGPAFYDTVMRAIHEALHETEMIPQVSLADSKEERREKSNRTAENTKVSVPEPFEKRRIAEAASCPVKSDAIARIYQKNQSNRCHLDSEGKNSQKTGTSQIQETTIAYRPTNLRKISEQDSLRETTDYHIADQSATKEIPAQKPIQMELFDDKILSEKARVHFEIIGQLFDTYWLIAYEDKLLIVDQHAAHEKVKYERFMKRFREHDIASQTINPPIVVTMSGKERECYLKHAEDFEALGFMVEEFGGNDYAIRGVPLDLYGYEEKEFFREILDELADESVTGTPESIRIRIATMACKAAVKGNMHMNCEEAEQLIDELLTLDNPYHCPHGRPTIVSMTKYELEKKFKRIVT